MLRPSELGGLEQGLGRQGLADLIYIYSPTTCLLVALGKSLNSEAEVSIFVQINPYLYNGRTRRVAVRNRR